MRALITFLFILSTHIATSYPSSGLVVLNNGNVYFTDTYHDNGTLWEVDKEGKLKQILSNFNASDLQIDKQGNLWLSESVWLDNVLDGKINNTLIKIYPNLKIDTLIRTSNQSQFNGLDIAIAPDKSIYFTNNNYIYKYHKSGSKKVIDHKFKMVNNITVDNKGTLWIADSKVNNGTLYYLKQGGILKKYMENLISENTAYALTKDPEKQFISSITFDGNGNIYVCENVGCRIIKIDRYKNITTFYQSPTLWAPTNVYFKNDNAYIKEIGFNKSFKGPRILIKNKEGTVSRLVNIQNLPEKEIKSAKNDNFVIPPWVYFGLGLITFAVVIIMAVRKQLSSES